MIKKALAIILTAAVMASLVVPGVKAADSSITLQYYEDVRSKNLSNLDLKNKSDLVNTLEFSSDTKWPSKDKLPEGFDPNKIIEYGKIPGLGIDKLHSEGYTGQGVNIAYIDQPLLEGHVAYKDTNVNYIKIRPEENGMQTSMHGPAVLSILAGSEQGVAPNANVYFFGQPAWLQDQRTHAEALYKLIEVNKTLPKDKKIRVVGFSDCADETEKYVEEFRKAIVEAEKNDIMVIDVTTFNYVPLTIKPYKNKDDYKNYEIAKWASGRSNYSGYFFVPTSGRTTATGIGGINKYDYTQNGGLSWGVPFVVGTIALGLQVDPTLTKEAAIKYLYSSGYDYKGGKIINPEGFVDMVTKNCKNPHDVTKDKDYRYFLYNKDRVSAADFTEIKGYLSKFNDGVNNFLLDVSSCKSAQAVYDKLKEESADKNGKLKGIQIFGTSKDVPAFNISFKIQMKDSIDDSGSFLTDFFYSTFKADSKYLGADFSIYKAFKEKLNVSFIPEWPVVRLPLTYGEIAKYLKNNESYVSSIKDRSFGNIVNFSNPIFASTNHIDDMGYFIEERLNKEFGILNDSEYKLYGNKQGVYPVKTNVAGGFTKDNISRENKEGIKEFLINTHGQWNNIDQCVFTTNSSSSEKRISFLNKSDINKVLSSNYYDLDLWTCLNAYNLDDNNIVHEAIANGKCMSAMAASSIISNNGVRNSASLADMKKNNFYYFYLNYFFNRALGKTRSTSFYLAQKAYAETILKHTDMLMEGNYQFNIHNVLSYHYLGVIEYWNVKGKDNFSPNINFDAQSDNTRNVESGKGNINFHYDYSGGGFKVISFNAVPKNGGVEFTMEYESSRDCDFSFFNPPNGNVIVKSFRKGIMKGKNTLKIMLTSEEIKKVISADSITMKFGFDEKCNYINFSTDQIADL